MSDFKAIQCTKFGFHWGSAPDPAGAYSASSDPLAVFRGSASNGMKGKRGSRKGMGWEGGWKGKGKGRGGKWKEGKGPAPPPILWPRTAPATGGEVMRNIGMPYL